MLVQLYKVDRESDAVIVGCTIAGIPTVLQSLAGEHVPSRESLAFHRSSHRVCVDIAGRIERLFVVKRHELLNEGGDWSVPRDRTWAG